jgi:hypothetical protein
MSHHAEGADVPGDPDFPSLYELINSRAVHAQEQSGFRDG